MYEEIIELKSYMAYYRFNILMRGRWLDIIGVFFRESIHL